MAPAAASAHRWSGGVGSMSRRTASTPATAAEMKMAATTNRPAPRSARSERSQNAMPRGTAVKASPKLWMRSASSATEPDSANMSVCTTAASPSTPSEMETALMPSRERVMEWWTRPWECVWGAAGIGTASGAGELARARGAGEAGADVLDVGDGLGEQLADVVVVEVVD